MRILFPIIFYLSFLQFSGSAQNLNIDETCEEANNRAVRDFKNGNIKLTEYGLIITEDYGFDEFYKKFMWQHYQIAIELGGCIVWDALLCYEEKMLELIDLKYGADFLQRSREEARIAYDTEGGKQSDVIGNATPEYIIANEMPEYPGGYQRLFNYMNSAIELAGISDALIGKKIFIQFSIGEEGSVSKANIVIVKGGSLDENNKIEVLKIFKATHWKPGTINGEPVQVQLVLPFSWE